MPLRGILRFSTRGFLRQEFHALSAYRCWRLQSLGSSTFQAGAFLLIDDVCTTGRTLRALAARLAKYNPANIEALVYLKTPDGPGMPVVRRTK